MTPTRAALEPFSKVPLAFTDDIDDDAIVFEYEGGALTLGDFRRVHEALSSASAADGEAVTNYVLVPRELTDDMKSVAAHIADGPMVSFQEHWEAMLAAAPSVAPADNTALREVLLKKLYETATYWTGTLTGLPSGNDVAEWLCNTLICEIEDMFDALSASGSPGAVTALTENQIKHLVDRFLGWNLPEDFNPDGGISFKKTFNEQTAHPMRHEPSGTNLFDASQADAMVRYMIDGISGADVGQNSSDVAACRDSSEASRQHNAEPEPGPSDPAAPQGQEAVLETLAEYHGVDGCALEDMLFEYYSAQTDVDRARSLTREYIKSIYTKFIRTRAPEATEAAAWRYKERGWTKWDYCGSEPIQTPYRIIEPLYAAPPAKPVSVETIAREDRS